eukprot:Skav213785  [mRNA]  locus=scaffold1122:36524:39640:- [translate_table: standard]
MAGETMSLYDVWDHAISEVVRTQESNFWLGGLGPSWVKLLPSGCGPWEAEAGRTRRTWRVAYKRAATRADRDQDGPFKSFERWLDEAVQFTCSKVDQLLLSKDGWVAIGQLPVVDALLPNVVAYVHPLTGKKLAGPEAETGQPVEIDESAYQDGIAGERTAIVLNDILDNKARFLAQFC